MQQFILEASVEALAVTILPMSSSLDLHGLGSTHAIKGSLILPGLGDDRRLRCHRIPEDTLVCIQSTTGRYVCVNEWLH